jgi:hypothetical protein
METVSKHPSTETIDQPWRMMVPPHRLAFDRDSLEEPFNRFHRVVLATQPRDRNPHRPVRDLRPLPCSTNVARYTGCAAVRYGRPTYAGTTRFAVALGLSLMPDTFYSIGAGTRSWIPVPIAGAGRCRLCRMGHIASTVAGIPSAIN